jgi:ATP-dependent Lon protease
MRDEAEIRGHRRTYIGSMPGRILTAMKECGTINPVIMFDELDKLGSDFRGDPASALLEVLDPAQNHAFSDRYLDIAYDLSNVLFIATANLTDTIPGPLLDRMEVLRLSGYTLHEKVQIAKKYLIPRAIENSGLKKKCLEFTEEGIETIVERYTREAGLRNLEREINNVCRKAARRQAEGAEACVKVDAAHVRAMLGPPRFDREDTRRAEHPGVAIGLAWTPSGGDILFIEATATPGTGQLTLTGQLGDVMKESAQAALTYLRSKGSELGIKSTSIGKRNVHVHVPAGAIPKDGPSAGVAMMMAMASLFLDRPLLKGLAMTGEITLKGSVLPVGGIKEKVLAAHRSGVRTLILPGENERDLEDIPEEIRRELDFHFVESADAAFEVGFPKQTRGKGGKKSARRRKSPSRRTGKASRK